MLRWVPHLKTKKNLHDLLSLKVYQSKDYQFQPDRELLVWTWFLLPHLAPTDQLYWLKLSFRYQLGAASGIIIGYPTTHQGL